MTRPVHREGEEGYLLLGLVVACFLILLVLGIAAPRVARQLERDREVESEQRALQYVRAIQLYYRKNNSYPSSIEQLLGTSTGGGSISGTGSVRYLRQQYKDPLTNDEYRLILAGKAKTEVKGFFGEPLQGITPGNIGGGIPGSSTPGSPIGGPSTAGTTPSGTSSSPGGGFSLGSSSFGSGASGSQSGTGIGSTSPTGTPASGTSGTGTTGSSASSSTDATTFQGSKGMFVGVGSNAKGKGLVEWNGSENIEDWEFLYDPRVELLKATVSLLGGTPAAAGSGSIGSGIGSSSGTSFGGSTPGSSPGSGSGFGGGSFGGSGSSFGGSSGGFGGTSNSPTSGTPQATPPTQ